MERDLCEKRFFSDEERFSDLFNGIVFQGERILKPEELMELDTQTGLWRRQGGSSKTKNGTRDLVRRVARGINYVVCGLENQEIIDYGAPLRLMGYDVGEYERQAALIRRQIRNKTSTHSYSKGEYLYGFAKDSKIHPTITLMLYYGEEWDGPRDFQTDVKQVFDFIRFSKDETALRKLIVSDTYYKNMNDDAYDMVAFYTDADMLLAKKQVYREGESYNMCKALDDIYQNGQKKGREEERKHTEEERKRAEEERKRAEEERKRAEKAEKRVKELEAILADRNQKNAWSKLS